MKKKKKMILAGLGNLRCEILLRILLLRPLMHAWKPPRLCLLLMFQLAGVWTKLSYVYSVRQLQISQMFDGPRYVCVVDMIQSEELAIIVGFLERKRLYHMLPVVEGVQIRVDLS